MRYILTVIMAVILFSCEKPEKPIKPYDRGNAVTRVIAMTSNYQYQVYYQLDSARVVKTVNRMDWDLALSSGTTPVLLTNTGRGIYVAKTHSKTMEEVKDTTGLNFYWGQPSLHADSLAFGAWWLANDAVYVINMGYDLNGMPLGFVKCKPQWLSDQSLRFTWSNLNDNEVKTLVVKPDTRYNFTYFSLLQNKMADVEPPKNQWDLVFTQYVKLLFAPPYPATRNYEVVGALINPYRVQAGFAFNLPFEQIGIGHEPDKWYNHRDVIGFDWKWFDIGTNAYTVNPAMNYILKTTEGYVFKLHFLDFYDDSGVKGYPKLEQAKI